GEPDDPPPVSALRVLRSLAGLLEAVLLGLLGAGVPAEEPGLLQLGAELGVELDEAAGDAQAEGAGLAGGATAVDGGVDVVHRLGLRQAERLREDHAIGVRREVVGDVATVDRDLAFAGVEADPGDGLLAAAGGLERGDG